MCVCTRPNATTHSSQHAGRARHAYTHSDMHGRPPSVGSGRCHTTSAITASARSIEHRAYAYALYVCSTRWTVQAIPPCASWHLTLSRCQALAHAGLPIEWGSRIAVLSTPTGRLGGGGGVTHHRWSGGPGALRSDEVPGATCRCRVPRGGGACRCCVPVPRAHAAQVSWHPSTHVLVVLALSQHVGTRDEAHKLPVVIDDMQPAGGALHQDFLELREGCVAAHHR